MDEPTFELAIENNMDRMGEVAEAAESFLLESGVTQQTVFKVLLAIEELVTNSIKYAYDDPGLHKINISISLQGDNRNRIELFIVDDGHPFDPADAPVPDLDIAPEDREIGGLGLHLVRQISQGLQYTRINNQNTVHVTFLRTDL